MLDGLGHRQHVAGVPVRNHMHSIDAAGSEATRVMQELICCGSPRGARERLASAPAVEAGLRAACPAEVEQRRGRLVQSGLAQRRVHHHTPSQQTVDDGPQIDVASANPEDLRAKLCDRADLVERLAPCSRPGSARVLGRTRSRSR